MKYIYKLLIGALILFISIGVYQQLNKKTARSFRLPCQGEVVFFEKVLKKDKLQTVQKLLKQGSYTLSITKEESKYMKTQLFNYLNEETVHQTIQQHINLYQLNNKISKQDTSVKINVLIYENDKLDPGKKTPKSKLYAGYLVFDFYLNDKKVYKGQIDFMDLQGKDISKRIDCMFKSFFSL